MSIPIKNVILPTLKSVLIKNPPPSSIDKVGKYVSDMMIECEKEARRNFKVSPNQLGRLNGDWFEYLFQIIMQKHLGKDSIMVFPGRGHHINEVTGFEKVSWIPMPDAIVRNMNDFRGVITLKWGMRHDRMYEAAYEAYAIKDWVKQNKLKNVKVYLFTNDNFSGYEARLATMAKVPALDGVYYLEHNKLPNQLSKTIKSFPDLINELRLICK